MDASSKILCRPIIGGVFGAGGYELASMPFISRGLHAVRYMVVEQAGGAVLSIADDKLTALAGARRVLRAASAPEGDLRRQASLWGESDLPAPLLSQASRPVSRRRREIFERSGGACHYCRATLALDGKWHVEHMVPKALDGTDAPLNLVAACVACNLAKRDRTALEYLVEGGRQ